MAMVFKNFIRLSGMPYVQTSPSYPLNFVDSTLDLVGTKGLWVMDKGYDNGIILDHFFA
jgi:hypothetical protein